MKRTFVNMAVTLVAAAVAGLGVAGITVDTSPTALAAAMGEAGSASMNRIYAVPEDVLAQREACYRAEEHRIEQEHAVYIPADQATYEAWHAQGGPAVVAWGQAVRDCQHRHTQPGGMWNYDALIFVGYGNL